MRQIKLVVLIAPLLLVSIATARPNFAPESLERYFRLEWSARPGPSGTTLEGYVYNKTDVGAIQMRLNIEDLDAAGKVSSERTIWVLGELPPASRAFFQTRVPQAASYRVEVQSFNWVSKNAPN